MINAVIAAAIAIGVGAAIAYAGSETAILSIVVVIGGALSVRYPMLLYAAFLYLGVFKSAPAVQALPFDVTAVTAFVLTCVCVYRWGKGDTQRPPVALIALLLLISTWMLVSLSWTTGGSYGEQKLLYFVTLTTLAAIAPFFLVRGPSDVRVFLVTVATLAGAVVLGVLFSPSSIESGRLGFGSSGETISSGRLLSSGAIALLFIPIHQRWLRLLAIALGIGLFLVALGVGSRGPLLAFVLAVLLVGAARVVMLPRRLIPMIGVLLAIGLAATSVTLPEVSRERLDVLSDSPGMIFTREHRASFYEVALELAKQHPFRGAGVGGYATVGIRTEEAGTVYPHNLFLELLSELGIVPVIALFLALVGLLVRIAPMIPGARTRDAELVQPVAALFVFALLAAQFSSDINGNREFWGMLGLAWLLSLSERKGALPQMPSVRPNGNVGAQRRDSEQRLSAGRGSSDGAASSRPWAGSEAPEFQ